MGTGDWGLGNRDWGLGTRNQGLNFLANPQYPIPNPKLHIT
ncbi:MAG: hypothetical protein V7L11_23620 [Nostoc sp.]